MREQLEKRLRELRAEFESGQHMLADLEKQRLGLEKTLLRISGAIQVLEEELGREQDSTDLPLEQFNAQAASSNGHSLSLQTTENE